MQYGVVQFDHLVHWVPDLDTAVRDYQALGFPADRITAVVLTGRGAPNGPVAGLHYLVP